MGIDKGPPFVQIIPFPTVHVHVLHERDQGGRLEKFPLIILFLLV